MEGGEGEGQAGQRRRAVGEMCEVLLDIPVPGFSRWRQCVQLIWQQLPRRVRQGGCMQ